MSLAHYSRKSDKITRYLRRSSYLHPMTISRTNFSYPSKRELEVLKLIAFEHTIPEIAEQLFISVEIVKTHRRHLLRKMNVRNTAGLMRKSFEEKILLVDQSEEIYLKE